MPTSATSITTAIGKAGARVISGETLIVPLKAYAEIDTPVLNPSSLAVDQIRDTLLKAGWAWTDQVQATAEVSGPFGWGYTSFQRLVLKIGDGTHGIAYEYYDPLSETAPFGWLGGIVGGYAIQAVPVGTSDAQSQSNLVIAINNGGTFIAVVTDSTHIGLTAIALGTLGNGIVCEGNGSISLASTSGGGGWVLESRSQASIEFFGNTSFIHFVITTGLGAGNLIAHITINGLTNTFSFGSYHWRLVADCYQACFISVTQIPGEDIFHDNNFLWICTPVADSNDGASKFVTASFVATGRGFPLSVGQANASNDVTSSVNSVVSITGQGTNWAAVMYHTESGILQDRANQPVITRALLALYTINGLRFIGYIPNAFYSSDPGVIGVQVTQGGYYYRCVCSQLNPAGSIWLLTGEVQGSTPAGGGTPTPQFAIGTGNVLLDNVFNRGLLVRTGGDPLALTMAGKALTISGVGTQFTVQSVASDLSSLFFLPPPTPVSNIKWQIPL